MYRILIVEDDHGHCIGAIEKAGEKCGGLEATLRREFQKCAGTEFSEYQSPIGAFGHCAAFL